MQDLDFVIATLQDAENHYDSKGDTITSGMFNLMRDQIEHRKQELLIKHQDEEN